MPTKNAHKKSWKSIQSATKIKKKTKLAFLVLGLILTLIVVSWIVHLTQTLFSPWRSPNIGQTKSYLWTNQYRLNLVVIGHPILVLSDNPQGKEVTILTIPDETFIDVSGGFGMWQARAIYDLGHSFAKNGDLLVKDSIESFLGIPIDGFLHFGGKGDKDAFALLEDVRKNPLSGLELLSKMRTNLTPWELINLKLSLMQVRFDKVKRLDLLNLNVLEKEFLHDGTQVLISDPIRLDSVLSDFVEPAFQRERLTIAVFNGTDHPQLAQKAKRLITNLGGNVIITATSEKKIEKTYVFGEKSKTFKRLTQIFQRCNSDNSCGKINLNDLGLDSSRAQINVVLGEDFFK